MKKLLIGLGLACCVLLGVFMAVSQQDSTGTRTGYGSWMQQPQSDWPQITMINQISYRDKHHPIGGCGFLLDTGNEVLGVTAKHVLIYFKSDSMDAVSFNGMLDKWKMFPKDNPKDSVLVDSLINEDPGEPLEAIPPDRDWVLFTLGVRSVNIQPLKMRPTPVKYGEKVYIVGWRYSDKDCPQVVYEGNFVQDEGGSCLISTEKLQDNTMPGLSGSPVIDADGYLIGLMSQKAGTLERPSSLEYPRQLLADRYGSAGGR